MLTFTKTKNTRLPVSVHNAGVTLQSRDIPHTLPSPIFYERAQGVITCKKIPQYCDYCCHNDNRGGTWSTALALAPIEKLLL
jgi:hypothetical protein